MTSQRRLRPFDEAPADTPAYISQAAMAHRLRVSRAVMANWLLRYDDCPPPAATVDHSWVYLPEQATEWRTWLANHPGRGSRRNEEEI
jgi:hypothetical protein